jgi:Acetyltransferase (GNAT) domain
MTAIQPKPTATPAWTIRPARIEDSQAAVDVLNQVYGYWGTEKDYHWKFSESPADFYLPAWVAESGGQVIAHYGMLALTATLDGILIRAGQSVDAGVLPAFRRMGIVSAIEQEILDQAARSGLTLIYAFPGLRSLAMHDRIGYSPFTFVPEMTSILEPKEVWGKTLRSLPGDLDILRRGVQNGSHSLSPEEIERMYLKRCFLILLLAWGSAPSFLMPRKRETGQYAIHQVDWFDARFDHLWSETCPQTGLSLVKNAGYLNWRYCASPSRQHILLSAERKGLLRGYLVLSTKLGEQWSILELNAAPGEEGAYDALLQEARRILKQAGASGLNAWSAYGSNTYLALRQHGFISQHALHRLARKNRFPGSWLNQIIIYTHHLPSEQQTRLLDRAKQWWISMGDSDLG